MLKKFGQMTNMMSQKQQNLIIIPHKEWNTNLFKFSQKQMTKILVLLCLQIQKVEEALSILEKRRRLLFKRQAKQMQIKGNWRKKITIFLL